MFAPSSSRYSDAEIMKLSSWISDKEKVLHDEFGMSYDEIENLEYAD
jgi:hypothetical protein